MTTRTTFRDELADFIRSGSELPALSSTVIELQAALAQDEVSEPAVLDVVERDPALAARLLRMANSAAYSRGDSLASLTAAVRRLGFRQVQAMAMAMGVRNAFDSKANVLHPEPFWRHCASVAATARLLALKMPKGGIAPDDAYTAGLLHDAGLLILDQYFPEPFQRVDRMWRELELPRWQQEEDLLGIEHGEIGGLLLQAWGLPSRVVNAVTYHHRPMDAPAEERAIAFAVHAAEAVCASDALSLEDEGIDGMDPRQSLELAGLMDVAVGDFLSLVRLRAQQEREIFD